MLVNYLITLASICSIRFLTTLLFRIQIHITSFDQEAPIPNPLQKNNSRFRLGLQYAFLLIND